MDLIKEYKSFIHSYYLGEGLRITTGAVLPALILGYFGWLSIGVLASLGAVCVSVADSPGPILHRRNGMQACIAILFVVCLITGLTASYPFALGCWVTIACFVFSMIGVYGGRVISIGIAALLVMVLNMNRPGHGLSVLLNALYVTAGGLWYMALSLVLYHVRPYKLIQQALGDCIMATADYLRIRSDYYSNEPVTDERFHQLLEQQVQVQQKQDLLRELLYKSRTIVRDSTVTSRTLMMMFIDTVDLYEKAVSAFYPARPIMIEGAPGLLDEFRAAVNAIAAALDDTGIAVKSGKVMEAPEALQQRMAALLERYTSFRNERLSPGNLEMLLSLRKMLQAIEDMSARISTLQNYTRYDKKQARAFRPSGDHDQFVTRTDLSWKLLQDNLSIKSDIFRHALRVSIAATAGYWLAHWLRLGHSYWILLTIIVILKPTYSLTKKRNYQRVLGTLTGGLAGILILYLVKDRTVLFLIMLVLMTATYSFIRTNYLLAVLCLTPYVLLLFHLLNNGEVKSILTDRVLDTVLGSVIAFTANYFLFPAWEQDQISRYQSAAIDACQAYYRAVASFFTEQPVSDTGFRLSRKQAFVALANLSDAFSRLLAEPRHKQKDARQVHQFVVLANSLLAHIAGLAHYINGTLPVTPAAFGPMIDHTSGSLDRAAAFFNGNPPVPGAQTEEDTVEFLPAAQLGELVSRRNKELARGDMDTNTRHQLARLKPVVDQFRFVDRIATDLANAAAGKTM